MLKSGAASARTHQSTRFLTSISQILVIFEPDSNLDTENPQNRFRTIVPSYQIEIDFAPKNTPY